MLLQNTEVCWLSGGTVLPRCFELRDELKVFFTDSNFHLTACMMMSFSHEWPVWVMFFLT